MGVQMPIWTLGDVALTCVQGTTGRMVVGSRNDS